MAEKKITATDWAKWVVTGDPNKRVPAPLRSLAQRIVTAIKEYAKESH
jgi:hypothetical protein